MQTGETEYTGRADQYDRFIFPYPEALKAFLAEHVRAFDLKVVADIGSGTGNFSSMLMELGLEVYAVEPNAAMRAVAERKFAKLSGFHSVAGSGASTTLAARSVDAVFSAQSIHWFYESAVGFELRRIARPGASCVLVNADSDPRTGGLGVKAFRSVAWLCGRDSQIRRFERTFQAATADLLGAPQDSARGRSASATSASFEAHRFTSELRLSFDDAFGYMTTSAILPRRLKMARAILKPAFHAIARGPQLVISQNIDLYAGSLVFSP